MSIHHEKIVAHGKHRRRSEEVSRYFHVGCKSLPTQTINGKIILA
jgi:hypothetical protein